MLRKILFVLINLFIAPVIFVQGQKVNLDRPLNTPLFNEKNPSVSGDGRFMILETDYGNEKLYPVISKAVAALWARPEDVTGINNPLTNDQHWSLNFDATEIYFASSRHGGIGQHDIWVSKKSGNNWTPPVNSGKPLNSSESEKYPSISADGRFMYFVRVIPGKSIDGSDCGKIYVSERSGNTWKEPVALPANVTTGFEAAPKILNDNRTLIFSSSRSGGKGKLDLYRTQLQGNNTWSDPVPLIFANTDQSEVFASLPLKGENLFLSADVKGKEDIFRYKVPEEFRPLPYQLVSTFVKSQDGNAVITSKVVVSQTAGLRADEQIYNNPADGKFSIVVAGKEPVDLTVYPMKKGYFFRSFKIIPGQTEIPSVITLVPLTAGNSISLESVSFSDSDQLNAGKNELDKIVRIFKENPGVRLEIVVFQPVVTIQSDAQPDSTVTDTTTSINSSSLQPETETGRKKAEAIIAYLVSKGVPAANLTGSGEASDATQDNSFIKTVVKVK